VKKVKEITEASASVGLLLATAMETSSANNGVQIKPVFQTKKMGQILTPNETKPAIFNNQCVVYKLCDLCDLCDADYVSYTARHLHQRINEHKYSVIERHLKQHGLRKTDLVDKSLRNVDQSLIV